MVFNSESFAIFAVIFVPIYFRLAYYPQLLFTLAASYFFYAWWSVPFCGLMIASTTFNYLLGRSMGADQVPGRRKLKLGLGIAVNLAALVFFKYTALLVDTLVSVSLAPHRLAELSDDIALPIGISFYTFHSLSYLIDVFRKKIPVERDPFVFATYIALWPQLVAGPIVRAHRLIPQLKFRKHFNFARFLFGMELVIIGFALKLIIADNLGLTVDRTFKYATTSSTIDIVSAVGFFAFQIYADFNGYSLIAIGFGIALGLSLGVNFRRPYLSSSFSGFWERWHISLSSWLRDYLYIPLGGSRGGALLTFRNLVLTMALGGMWHGAKWTFLVWGLLHGGFLVAQRVLGGFRDALGIGERWARALLPVQIILVFFCVCFAWIFFRAPDFSTATYMIGRIAAGGIVISEVGNKFRVVPDCLYISVLIALEIAFASGAFHKVYRRSRALRAGGCVGLLLATAAFGNFTGGRFIYFQF